MYPCKKLTVLLTFGGRQGAFLDLTLQPHHDADMHMNFSPVLMESAVRPPAPNDCWRIIWGCTAFSIVEGVEVINNRVNCRVERTGEQITVQDPKWGVSHTFDVFKLTKKSGDVVTMLMGEISNGVWASGIRDT